MEAEAGDATDDAARRLQEARPSVPVASTEAALDRLRTALFGAAPRHPAIERYPIIRRIGEGGAGVVYLAHDVQLDRDVAIKLIRSDHDRQGDGSTSSRDRLLREAEAIARAPHPNILAIYDIGTTNDEAGEPCTFLVLEYVDGVDLRTWLGSRPPWQRVLEVFVAAGRGLAAAHAAGVTHRDFKPANAMIGEDGRVRVLDFGLARATLQIDPRRTLDDLVTDTHLTEEGFVAGTPAYMAPEQHAGETATAASDQYGFCVALWEGLFGARPFVGQSVTELARAKRRGPPRAPDDSTVPGPIVRAVQRGLAPAPTDRFTSMAELIAALELPHGRRAWGVAALAVVVVVGLVAATWRSADARCDADIASASLSRREAVDAAFAASDDVLAIDTLARVGARMDRFDVAWRAGYGALCSSGAQEIGAEAFDRRMACLQRQQRDADAIAEVLADADDGLVTRALEVADGLPNPAVCADAEWLAAEVAPPSDARLAARVADLRADLARVHALDAAGKVGDALAAVRDVVEQVKSIDHPPLLAEALYALGNVEENNGDHTAAARTLEEAQTLAVACKHERLAARAAQNLVFVVGHRLGELDRALRWAELAKVAIQRLGDDEDPSRLLAATAAAYHRAGRPREAASSIREALETYERRADVDDGRLGLLHNNLGDALRGLGENDEAAEHLEKAQALWSAKYGPEHPRLAMVLGNLGTIDLGRDDTIAAEAKFRQVVAMRERVFGGDHPLVASSLVNLATALRHNGALAEAQAALDRGIAILRQNGPEEHGTLVVMLTARGRVVAQAGDAHAAMTNLDEAVALAETALSATHPDKARALALRAGTKLATSGLVDARADFDRAIEISIAAHGADHAKVATMRLTFAQVLWFHGHTTDAIAIATAARDALGDRKASVAADIAAWLAAPTGTAVGR